MQGGGDAEPLPHPEGVVPDPAVGLGRGQADQVEHLLDPAARQSHELLGEGEDLAAGATGVLGGGVEQDADLESGVGQVDEAAPGDGGAAGVGRVSPTMIRMWWTSRPRWGRGTR